MSINWIIGAVSPNTNIKRTEIGKVEVITTHVKPLNDEPYYETIIMGGRYNFQRDQAETVEQALKDHSNAVTKVRRGNRSRRKWMPATWKKAKK